MKGELNAREILVDDFLIAEWVYKLVYVLPPESIDSQKFSREWIDFQFDRVKYFYYGLFLGYVLYLYSQIQLILYDQKQIGQPYYFMIAWVILFTAQSLMQEMIQLINEGRAYFTDPANYIENLQIVLNIVLIGLKLSGHDQINVYLALTMVCLSMVKLNIQLRVFEYLGPVVLLIAQCVADTRHFVIYLIIWIVFFV